MKTVPIVIPFTHNRKRVLYEQKSPQFVHLVNYHSDIDIFSFLILRFFPLYRFETVLFTDEDISKKKRKDQ